MKKIFPNKLKNGDTIALIAPSASLSFCPKKRISCSTKILQKMGLGVRLAKNVWKINEFDSSSVKDRIADLHWAFLNPKIQGIIAVDGGYNSNQILENIDWDIIKNNPKIFCGYSDITALQNAMLAKTGLVTYSGPCFVTWSSKVHQKKNVLQYTKNFFVKNVFDCGNSEITIRSDKWWNINNGSASGTIIGGNLCTLNLLQGTDFFPDLSGSILFIEDDHESNADIFDRDLESLCQVKNFKNVRGLVIGRFENKSKITQKRLRSIISNKKRLRKIPVIANANFGHTSPIFTFPIGGKASVYSGKESVISIKTNE